MRLLYYRHKAFPTQIFWKLLILNAALFFVLTRDEHYTDTFEAVSATLWLHRMDRHQLSQNF